MTMAAGALAMLVNGFNHTWSVYVPYVIEKTGWTTAQTSACYYMAFTFFVLGNIIGGRILERTNTGAVLICGGFLQFAGVGLSGFLLLTIPWPMYFTYGVMQGLGQGMVYTVVVSTAQMWFPNRKGFAAGIVITANGLCALYMAPLSRLLLERYQIRTIFIIVAFMILVVMVLASIFVKLPAETESKSKEISEKWEETGVKQYTPREMISTRRFYLLLLTMLMGLLPYLFISPNALILLTDRETAMDTAVAVVMVGTVINAVMRLVVPTLADRFGRVRCIQLVLMAAMITMVCLTSDSTDATALGIVLIYGCYGGIMGSFPVLTSSIFGLKHAGENYGYVMLGIIVSTLAAPGIIGIILAAGYELKEVIAVGAVGAFLALLCMTALGAVLKQHHFGEDVSN